MTELLETTTLRYTIAPLNVSDFNDDTFEGLQFFTNPDLAYNRLDVLEKKVGLSLDVYEVDLNITFI